MKDDNDFVLIVCWPHPPPRAKRQEYAEYKTVKCCIYDDDTVQCGQVYKQATGIQYDTHFKKCMHVAFHQYAFVPHEFVETALSPDTAHITVTKRLKRDTFKTQLKTSPPSVPSFRPANLSDHDFFNTPPPHFNVHNTCTVQYCSLPPFQSFSQCPYRRHATRTCIAPQITTVPSRTVTLSMTPPRQRSDIHPISISSDPPSPHTTVPASSLQSPRLPTVVCR